MKSMQKRTKERTKEKVKSGLIYLFSRAVEAFVSYPEKLDFKDFETYLKLANPEVDPSNHSRKYYTYGVLTANVKKINDMYVELCDPKGKCPYTIRLIPDNDPSLISTLRKRGARKLYICGKLIAYSDGGDGRIEIFPDKDFNEKSLVEIKA